MYLLSSFLEGLAHTGVLFYLVPGIELRILCSVGKRSTTELNPQPPTPLQVVFMVYMKPLLNLLKQAKRKWKTVRLLPITIVYRSNSDQIFRAKNLVSLTL